MLLDLGAEIAVFQKPNKMGQHMKPLYIKGYLDGEPINHMLVDTGACVNIMPHVVFEKLGHHESELMKTNMVLNGFSGEASEAKGILSKELTVGSKTVPMAFFVVDVKGKYNVLLGREWIHTNGCVPSTLH
jgi:predicted aspartyl protease